MMPGDAAAVVIARGAARQDLTHDKQRLLKAVDRFTGTLDAGEPASLKQQRARAVVRLVTDLAAALDHTGGFAVTGTNNYRDPFDRIVRESSTYYLLAYTSTNDKSDGKYRRTDIKVKRAGVQVFYRAGYLARR